MLCLCYRGLNGFFRIWNPATRVYRDIAYPDGHYMPKTHWFGFGFVPSTDDYNIVSIFKHSEDYQVPIYDYVVLKDAPIYLFSSRAGLWEKMSSLKKNRIRFGDDNDEYTTSPRICPPFMDKSVCVGGCLYWKTFQTSLLLDGSSNNSN